jgi:hypothetical protein
MAEQENTGAATDAQGKATDVKAGTEPENKTFTQAEVDRLIQERLARAKGKTETATKTIEAQLADVRAKLAQADIKAALAFAGVPAERADVASRLVDVTKCVDEAGLPDGGKIKTEVDALLKTVPEFRASKAGGMGLLGGLPPAQGADTALERANAALHSLGR